MATVGVLTAGLDTTLGFGLAGGLIETEGFRPDLVAVLDGELVLEAVVDFPLEELLVTVFVEAVPLLLFEEAEELVVLAGPAFDEAGVVFEVVAFVAVAFGLALDFDVPSLVVAAIAEPIRKGRKRRQISVVLAGMTIRQFKTRKAQSNRQF